MSYSTTSVFVNVIYNVYLDIVSRYSENIISRTKSSARIELVTHDSINEVLVYSV